ncbi:MAG TPA: hypothetical protein VNU46_02275 [Gemmatimonadaceae bacterium]|nr:hypothetical protein [Gemmatimonadaceae bacterium]
MLDILRLRIDIMGLGMWMRWCGNRLMRRDIWMVSDINPMMRDVIPISWSLEGMGGIFVLLGVYMVRMRP